MLSPMLWSGSHVDTALIMLAIGATGSAIGLLWVRHLFTDPKYPSFRSTSAARRGQLPGLAIAVGVALLGLAGYLALR